MRVSSLLLASIFTTLNWNVVSATYALNQSRSPATRNHIDLNQRQIHNADYSTTTGPPSDTEPKSWDTTGKNTDTPGASQSMDATQGNQKTTRDSENRKRMLRRTTRIPLSAQGSNGIQFDTAHLGLSQRDTFSTGRLMAPTTTLGSDDMKADASYPDISRRSLLSAAGLGTPVTAQGSNGVQFDTDHLLIARHNDNGWWMKRQASIQPIQEIAHTSELIHRRGIQTQAGSLPPTEYIDDNGAQLDSHLTARTLAKPDLPEPIDAPVKATEGTLGSLKRWTQRDVSAMDAWNKLSHPIISK